MNIPATELETLTVEAVDPHDLAVAETIAWHTEAVSNKLQSAITNTTEQTIEQAQLLNRVQEYANAYEAEADSVNSQIEAGATPDVTRLNSALLNFHAVSDELNNLIEQSALSSKSKSTNDTHTDKLNINWNAGTDLSADSSIGA